MGGWLGGQAEYVTVPYADWNLLKFPDRDQAMEKIQDLAMLSDIFPTGYHGAWTAGVTTGSTVYIAGAGPVGLACATSAHLLGAAVVIVADMNTDRLRQAASFGCETINLSETDDVRGALQQILGGAGEVDAAVDCVGFEARGHGTEGSQGEAPATVLNTVMDITRSAGRLGIPGLYVTGDPGAVDEPAKVGSLSIRIGLGWAKSHAFTDRPVPGDEVQPPADDGDPARQGADRQERQRDRDPARPGPPGLPGLRQGRGPQVRHRPPRHGRLTTAPGAGPSRPPVRSNSIDSPDCRDPVAQADAQPAGGTTRRPYGTTRRDRIGRRCLTAIGTDRRGPEGGAGSPCPPVT